MVITVKQSRFFDITLQKTDHFFKHDGSENMAGFIPCNPRQLVFGPRFLVEIPIKIFLSNIFPFYSDYLIAMLNDRQES